ncbi:hypothetical protein BLS_002056 [Venturia inaequalis]|uniref:Uncharacterized protein n=1 Tax=Venturia inaequalis TaxID=5025 RepID=A0A8H3UVX7_VENIN|nr:hypothetical protein BLS_002056 [Venturia inaequalis]
MTDKPRGLEFSKWAPPGMARPHGNPNLATTLNLGQASTTPKSKSVPLLGAAAVQDSSSPAAREEPITPRETEKRRESFKNSVHKVAFAARVLQDDTDITVVDPPTPSPAKQKENQLPASALPFTLRSSSLPQPSAADKMAGAKPSSSVAVTEFQFAGTAPLSIIGRLAVVKHKHVIVAKQDHQADVKPDKKAGQDNAETARIEADRIDKEKPAVARTEAERIANEKNEAAAKESELRAKEKAGKDAEFGEKDKAQAAAKEAERSAKEKGQAAAKEMEKACAAAKEAERCAEEMEKSARLAQEKVKRVAKEKAQAAAEEAKRLAQEKAERAAKEKAAAKVELQKVINTKEVTFKALETKIDIIKVTFAKLDQEGLSELELAQRFIEEIKQDKEEISCLMTQAIADVKEAQEIVDQTQPVVENLKEKVSSLDDTLAEVNQIVCDKEKNLSDIKKSAWDQIAVFKVKQDETVKEIEQLVKQFAILETSNDAADAQKVDVVAPEVATKATVEVNGLANGQVEAEAKTDAQTKGRAKLTKSLNETYSANSSAEECKNVETDGRLTFSACPQVAADREGLAVRRVKLTNLPVKANLKRIVRLVWGGSVLDFIYTDGQPCAEVLFVKPEDCKRYFDSTPNGIEYPGSKDRHIDVEACPPEPARGNVQEILARGMTRCVRVMDVEPDCSQLALEKIAAGKGNKRTVETIISGTDPKGRRVVEFRFGKIVDAIIFKAELHRSVEWELKPSNFCVDPCETHSGLHRQ